MGGACVRDVTVIVTSLVTSRRAPGGKAARNVPGA